ncbi:MAG: hypothetical protein O7E52_28735 [Candidatus Poribacteria bacterium]|nr:hypothetical protein [Candidatus Poribacteria bacterium]
MAEVSAGKRSYLAMLLSIIIPGLGQIYLRRQAVGFLLFLGFISALGLIYINSLPVKSWQDLTRIDRIESISEVQQSEEKTEADSTPENTPPQNERSYHLYTFEDKLLFRMRPEFQRDLADGKNVSESLWEVFQGHRVLLSKNATLLTKKEDSQWLINDSYQTYAVKKEGEGLDVYAVKKLMFRPSWKFKISGLIQLVIFWVYAIFDGWLGRRGFNKRAFRKKLKETQERHEAEARGEVDDQ